MKSFQTSDGKTCKASLKKCVHGRSRPDFHASLPGKQTNTNENGSVRQRNEMIDEHQDEKQCQDPFKENLKYLIAQNEAYFRNKLLAADNGRPNNLKLKIPAKTGGTIYKRDYQKSLCGSPSMKTSQSQFFPNKQTSNNFFDQTTYKSQFVAHKQPIRRIHKKQHRSVDESAPTFLETQYKNTFLNWGGDNNVPSMKPTQRPAVTNLPLQSHSAYSLEFTHKNHTPVKSFKPVHSRIDGRDKENKNGPSSVLVYQTTSKIHHDLKNYAKEQNLKPKTQTLGVSGSYFKGKTEYQNEFISAHPKLVQDAPAKTLQELQNLMLQ